jgi:hypothetical protein
MTWARSGLIALAAEKKVPEVVPRPMTALQGMFRESSGELRNPMSYDDEMLRTDSSK